MANDIVTIYKTSDGKVELQSQLVLPSKTVAVEVVEGTPYDLARGLEARLVVVDNQGGRQVYVDGRHYDGVIKLVKLQAGASGAVKRGIGQLQVRTLHMFCIETETETETESLQRLRFCNLLFNLVPSTIWGFLPFLLCFLQRKSLERPHLFCIQDVGTSLDQH